MNETPTALAFDDANVGALLDAGEDAALDELDFGVIGFDVAGVVRRYNRCEAAEAGLSRERVIGRDLFTDVAPCMNNFLVAQRFEDARRTGEPLDAVIAYVLTLRMKPVPVALRLVARPGSPMAYVLVRRRARA